MADIRALYCHLPFCRSICPFCAFAVHRERPALHGPYLAALREEARLLAAPYGHQVRRIQSLYLGGGTPSTLALEEVAQVLEGIRATFPLAEGVEIAFEVNPEDAAPAYLAGLARLGVNRVSLGLQSLDDATLRRLGRTHSAEQGRSAWQATQAAGLGNVNVDLMFGAPQGTGEAFAADVRKVLEWQPAHVSLYGLDVEPGTPFGRDRAVLAWVAEQREAQADQYLAAARALSEQGYLHYEVSNFALPGRQGRQNLLVWEPGNYLGLGLGAHSHVDGLRWSNERHLPAYLRRLQAGERPVAFLEQLSAAQQANEHLLLTLRQSSGLAIAQWEARHALDWGAERQALVERLVRQGQARWEAGVLSLTPTGFLLADGITAQLMLP